MLPIQERNAVYNSILPSDPDTGQVIVFPSGQIAGGSNVISVYDRHGKLIGAAQQLAPVANVSRMYELSRVSSCQAIAETQELHIVARQFNYNSVMFVQYFGWIGHGFDDKPLILSDKRYKVLAALKTGPSEPSDFFLYEKVCLTSLEETHK